MKSTDTFIIGGGVIGASIAYHLALKGCKNIVVIDKGETFGAGSTSRAAGGFRCQFGTEVNIRLSLLAREKLLRFEEELNIDSGYRQCGYLFLAGDEHELNAMRAAKQLQRNCGVTEVVEVSLAEIHKLNPAISLDEVIGGVFCPIDGFIRPLNILQGYINGAKRLGVEFKFGVELQDFKISKTNDTAHIVEATTSVETFAVGNVINAAGAWAGLVAKKANIEIPVTPLRRQVAVLRKVNLFPEMMPMTIFVKDGFHFRVRDGRTLLLMPVDEISSFNTHVDDTWLEQIRMLARLRIPSVANLARHDIDRENSWAGLYEMSPDKHALIGQTQEIENFYMANGSSGHGVMHAPAIGQLLAELIVEGEAISIDINSLRPSRFIEGQAIIANDFL
ncbi:MAG: FAD-binding oxidoreductase [Pyrinomonadaceae bacterium]